MCTRISPAAAVFGFALCMVLGGVTSAVAAEDAKQAFTLTPDEHGMVLTAPDGQVVFSYMTRKPKETNLTANSVCCLYPMFTPSGERVVDFAPGDHRHHRGVFLAWHAMQGKQRADFWGWGEFAPTEGRVIENRGVKLLTSSAKKAVVGVRNDWVADDEVMIEEALSITAREAHGVYVVDLEFTFTPKVDVTLNETAFGGFCVKGRKDGKPTYTSPEGKVELPNPHHLKPETDWPAADWYDYTIRLDSGKTVGIAVVDHPDNPPSTWHNLEPIAMVNPCIVAPGEVKRKQGEVLALKYRLVVHDGPPPMDVLRKLSKQWRAE